MPPPSSTAHLPPTQPAARQRVRSPARVLAEAEEQWLFTEAELANTPSIQDGMSPEKEMELRAKGINFIRQVGIQLKLPELTLSTAAIFFNRYLMRKSLVDRPGEKALHHFTLGGTALFLATKVEECCRRMKEIVVACVRVAQKNPNLVIDEQSKDWWKWRDTILYNEDILLDVLCFDLTIEAPHKQFFDMLKFYRVEHNKQLRNSGWAFITDSNTTQLCLLASSRTIAVAALFAGARLHEVKLPDHHGRPWWEAQQVRLKDMLKATNYMCKSYEQGPANGDGGQSIYVGLRTPEGYESELPDGEEPLWERTRLKSEQGITTPLQPDVDIDRGRQASVSSQGSKRARDDADSGRNGDGAMKRRRLSPTNGETNGKASPPQKTSSGPAPVAVPVPVEEDPGDGSEEGEVEE